MTAVRLANCARVDWKRAPKANELLKLIEDFACVLAKTRRWQPDLARCFGGLPGEADRIHRRSIRERQRQLAVGFDHLGVLEQGLVIVDRHADAAKRVDFLEQRRTRKVGKTLLQEWFEFADARGAFGTGIETWVRGQLRHAEEFAQVDPRLLGLIRLTEVERLVGS